MKIEFSADTFVGKQACLLLFYVLHTSHNIYRAIKVRRPNEKSFHFGSLHICIAYFYFAVSIQLHCRSPPVFDFFQANQKRKNQEKSEEKNNEQQQLYKTK